MKKAIVFFLLVSTCKLYGQCGREYPFGLYHNSKFINYKGDTLNKKDSAGFYEGLHVYTDNPKSIYTDSNTYLLGHFKHGQAVGDWIDHCKDGSYSTGPFKTTGELSYDSSNDAWINKKQGINVKIGVWKYYSKENLLLKTLRYDRYEDSISWANKTNQLDSGGTFVLVKLESKTYYSPSRQYDTSLVFTSKGILVSALYSSPNKFISYQYFANGQVRSIFKCRTILGIKTNRSIHKKYSEEGKLIEKIRDKCRRRRKHNDSF